MASSVVGRFASRVSLCYINNSITTNARKIAFHLHLCLLAYIVDVLLLTAAAVTGQRPCLLFLRREQPACAGGRTIVDERHSDDVKFAANTDFRAPFEVPVSAAVMWMARPRSLAYAKYLYGLNDGETVRGAMCGGSASGANASARSKYECQFSVG